MKYNYNRICVLDTETTSCYWNTAAPVQIAAIVCDKQGNILDSFNERIKTTHRIDPAASEVHGIYASDLVNCRSEMDVLTDFCEWMAQQEVDCILTYNGEALNRLSQVSPYRLRKRIFLVLMDIMIVFMTQRNKTYLD